MKHSALLLALAALPLGAVAQQTTFTSAGDTFAWSANAGWLDFAPQRPSPGDGVRVGDACLAGYAWSANTGWINFGDGTPANGIHYLNDTGADSGVNHDGGGNLSGLAWSANLGWINFGWAEPGDSNRPRFDLATGNFAGYAWSANTGWINLASGLLRTVTIAITDTDHDGISDAWELFWVQSLTPFTGISDYDSDGLTDKQEYWLDSNPLVPNAPLRITRISKVPNTSAVELEWPSSPARIYGIEAKPDVTTTNWVILGDVPGSAGTNTVQAIEAGGQPKAFFRVGSKIPLQP